MRYMDSNCTVDEKFNPHRYVFTGVCIVSKKIVTVEVPSRELYAYRQGRNIQDAMRSVSAGDREFLLTGISDTAFDEIFEAVKPKELPDWVVANERSAMPGRAHPLPIGWYDHLKR